MLRFCIAYLDAQYLVEFIYICIWQMQDINLPMFKSFHLLINVKMLQMFDVIGSNKLFVDRMNGLML